MIKFLIAVGILAIAVYIIARISLWVVALLCLIKEIYE
jgi:hypothetical protein